MVQIIIFEKVQITIFLEKIKVFCMYQELKLALVLKIRCFCVASYFGVTVQ